MDQKTSDAVAIIAVVKAKPAQSNTLRAVMTNLVEQTRKEAGCLEFVLFEVRDQPGKFMLRETFRDQAALDGHFEMPYIKAFVARFDELLQEPPEINILARLA